MAQIESQNPGSSEIQSPLIAGITEGLNKLSSIFNLKTGTLNDVKLTPVPIDSSPENKNRIYEASTGNRLWLSSPAPVIKKNGSEITQSGSNFTIDYIGGSVTFSSDDKPSDDDNITVSATYIISGSEELDSILTSLSAVKTQSEKYKGNYDNLGALQLAHSSAKNGDFAIVFSPLAVYAWKDNGWYDTRSIEDLSNYYNKIETENLLNQKEPSIQQKGSSTSDDDYYWGGRKTWQSILEKVRSTTLSGLSTASDAVVTASDTVLSAIGKLQSQVSKATQRAYLSGTGAPSSSTAGSVGQRYVNTSNGDEYTCQSSSGGTYVWRLHTKSVNNKTPDQGGNIKLIASDVGAAEEKNGVSVYTHTREDTVNNLSGTGPNGRALITENIQAGDTWTVNGSPVTAYLGASDATESMAGDAYTGKWVTFVYEDGILNFKGGGGAVSVSGLSAANIKTGVSVTIKQGAKVIQEVSGTFTNDADSTASDLRYGKTAYVNGEKLTGEAPDNSGKTVTTSSRTTSGNNLVFGIPSEGFYSSSSKVQCSYSNVASTIGLTESKIVQGNTILGISGTGGLTDAWPNGAVGMYINNGTYGVLSGSVDESNQGLHQPIHYDGNTSQFVLFTPQKAGTLHVRWLGATTAASFWASKGSSTATEDRIKTFSTTDLRGEDTFQVQANQQYGIWLNSTGACRYLFVWME